MDNKQIVLYGASGHGKVIADILEMTGKGPILFWDDKEQPHFPYSVTFPNPAGNHVTCIVSIGDNKIRRELTKNLHIHYSKAIHPSAIIARNVTIGDGTVIMAGAVINPGVRIGDHCIINTMASIDHDCTIENFVHLSPGVHLAGDVRLAEGVHVGIGSNIIQGVSIGQWVTVGAGSVILQDIPDYAVVVGVPGKVIKFKPVGE